MRLGGNFASSPWKMIEWNLAYIWSARRTHQRSRARCCLPDVTQVSNYLSVWRGSTVQTNQRIMDPTSIYTRVNKKWWASAFQAVISKRRYPATTRCTYSSSYCKILHFWRKTCLKRANIASQHYKVITLHYVIIILEEKKLIPQRQEIEVKSQILELEEESKQELIEEEEKEFRELVDQDSILPPWVIDVNACKKPVVLNIDLSKEIGARSMSPKPNITSPIKINE